MALAAKLFLSRRNAWLFSRAVSTALGYPNRETGTLRYRHPHRNAAGTAWVYVIDEKVDALHGQTIAVRTRIGPVNVTIDTQTGVIERDFDVTWEAADEVDDEP